MALNNVEKFLNKIETTPELRKTAYKCNNKSELDNFLKTNDLHFTYNEFEAAIDMLHVKCQTEEQANELFEKINWFKFLYAALP